MHHRPTFRVGALTAGMSAVFTLAQSPATSAPRAHPAPACTSVVAPSQRLELSDGRIVSLDIQSLARAGQSVLAAGKYAYVFPPDANSRTSPTLVDSIVGVLVDGERRVTLVSSPTPLHRVHYPRVAAMPDGSFSMLYVTTAAEGLLRWTDTGTIWHAVLRNGRWSVPSRVAALRTATLDRASELLQRDGQLSFIYPFRDNRRYDEDGGAVLLRWRRGIWATDTLRTATEPAGVSAVHDPASGSIVALLAIGDAVPNEFAQRLYLARFDVSWGKPLLVAGNGYVPVALPSLAVQGAGFVASWLTRPDNDPRRGSLNWLQVGRNDRIRLRSAIDSGASTFPYEMVMVDGRHPLWLYHGEPFASVATIVMAKDSGIIRMPDMPVPFWNPSTKTIALSGSRFLVFTQKRALTDAEPMAASFTTALEIRCPK